MSPRCEKPASAARRRPGRGHAPRPAEKRWAPRRGRRGDPPAFTLLEVLVAMALLSVTLLTLYQAYSSNLVLVQANRSTWKAMIYVNNELMAWERRPKVSVSVSQGEFAADDAMAGYSWLREIKDEEPIPGVTVRKVELVLTWQDGMAQRSYRSHIYVAAN